MKKLPLLILAFFFLMDSVDAQCPESVRRIGENYYKQGEFGLALDAFLLCVASEPSNADLNTKIGICQYQTNQLEKAVATLLNTKSWAAAQNQEALLILSKSLHELGKFKEAADVYKYFLKQTKIDHPQRQSVIHEIARCATGLALHKKTARATVINMGLSINSQDDDFKPVLARGISDCILFSSNRRPRITNAPGKISETDIYRACLAEGDWKQAAALDEAFANSTIHESAVGFNASGTALYLVRGRKPKQGILLSLALHKSMPGLPSFINTDLRGENGDRDPFFLNDSTMLFSSARPGGYGGYDLYYSWLKKGEWTKAVNFGPAINSPFDETSPFMAEDGISLFFSSNAVDVSCGGTDIVKSTWLPEIGKWSGPENLGLEFNTAGDEEDFTLDNTGTQAYFTSSSKKGIGGKDLYFALLQQPFTKSLTGQYYFFSAEKLSEKPNAKSENIASIVLNPIYFGLPQGSENKQVSLQLQELARFIKLLPEARVVVTVHCGEKDNSPSNTTDILNEVAAKWRGLGVDISRIRFINAGSQFPAFDGEREHLNKRLVVFISNKDELGASVSYNYPPDILPPAKFFHSMMNSLCFSVLLESREEATNRKFRQLTPVLTEELLPEGGISLLSSGFHLTYAGVSETFKYLRSKGLDTMRIAAYVDGWEISKEEAGKLLSKYPDLQNFIDGD